MPWEHPKYVEKDLNPEIIRRLKEGKPLSFCPRCGRELDLPRCEPFLQAIEINGRDARSCIQCKVIWVIYGRELRAFSKCWHQEPVLNGLPIILVTNQGGT